MPVAWNVKKQAKCGNPGTPLPSTLQGLHSGLKVLDGQAYLVLNAEQFGVRHFKGNTRRHPNAHQLTRVHPEITLFRMEV
jgi:hypothetical protein